MTTVRDIVERAYRKIGVVAHDEPLTADQAANGRDAFNMMVAGWALHGIDTETGPVDLPDAFPLQAKFEDATVYLLAEKLAPDFVVAAPFADDAFRAIQAAYMQIEEAEIPGPIQRMSYRYRSW